jgi:rhamnose transport system ATP-binding protein
MSGISKTFPGVRALEDVSFTLRAGEIHALVGENGAGKSTFIKVLAGVHTPDSGSIRLNDRLVTLRTPLDAQRLGIAAIHQHAALYPDLSVEENIFIGHEFLRGGIIRWRRTRREAKRLLDEIGAAISPSESVGALSVAKRQMVEIAKALSVNACILIMDEPTAALSKRESVELYEISRRLRAQGTAIILISHRFEDVFGLADRVTVLRDGRGIGTWDIGDVDESKLVNHMVGRELTQFYPKKPTAPGRTLLEVKGLGRMGSYRDVSLSVRAGEIVGLTGLVGAGRTEVVETLFGAARADTGSINWEGKRVQIRCPLDAMRLGIGMLPEDRQIEGLLLPWSVGRNITLPSLDTHSRKGFLSARTERRVADLHKEKLSIKAPSVDTPTVSLSGGNQQKVVLGKLLATKPKLLLLDEPTKGVDVGSKAAIYEIMSDLAAQGIGILMVSSEMPEVMHMADRIIVMREGRVSAAFDADEYDQNRILEAMIPVAIGS